MTRGLQRAHKGKENRDRVQEKQAIGKDGDVSEDCGIHKEEKGPDEGGAGAPGPSVRHGKKILIMPQNARYRAAPGTENSKKEGARNHQIMGPVEKASRREASNRREENTQSGARSQSA